MSPPSSVHRKHMMHVSASSTFSGAGAGAGAGVSAGVGGANDGHQQCRAQKHTKKHVKTCKNKHFWLVPRRCRRPKVYGKHQCRARQPVVGLDPRVGTWCPFILYSEGGDFNEECRPYMVILAKMNKFSHHKGEPSKTCILHVHSGSG